MAYPEPLERLIAAFERFPGVGRRTAERLAFHVLRDREARELAPAIARAIDETTRCAECGNVADRDPCPICADPARDAGTILVVEEPRDVEAVERSGAYRGRYHVLMGALNPAEGVDEEHLRPETLVRRILSGRDVREVILGTDPDAEGEATLLYVLSVLDEAGARIRVTRLARGLPAGSALEYLHRGVLEDALAGRVVLRP
ncbi:MAG: recombination mediator RecR [Planctomycetota bacterium]